MNDDEIEQRLTALQPAGLPPELQTRLAARPVARGKIRWLFAAAPLAAAACWFLVLTIERPVAPEPRALQPSDFRVFVPVEQTSTLIETRDVAFIDTDPARPVRLVRATWFDDTTYRGDDGRTLRRRQPRIEFIPVVLNSF